MSPADCRFVKNDIRVSRVSDVAPLRPRVLWADDDALLLRSVGRFLAATCDVMVTESVDEAVAHAAAGEFDVFVTDMRMGADNPDGFEAARRVLAARGAGPAVIIFSGVDDDGLIERAAAEGFALIHKREHPKLLREAILRAVARRSSGE